VGQTTVSGTLDRDAIGALGPADFRSARLEAFDRYLAIPEPTERSEGWRRTDLRGLDLSPAGPKRAEFAARVDVEDARRGAVVSAFGDAIPPQAAADLKRITTGLSTGRYSAIAQATWQSGAYVLIPDGFVGAAPIEIDWKSGPYPRLHVFVGKNARVSIVERHAQAERFASGVVDLVLDDGAHLTYGHIQDAPRDAIVFSHQRAHIGRDAKLVTLNFAIGGRLSRADVEVELRGQGAESDMLGLVFGENDQQFDFHTLQGHRAPDTRSDLLFKSALDDRSHSTYTGVISIGKDAPRSEAYQANRNLLLSDGARADTEPKLEILIDDVARCTHGATIGPVDDEQLFYLRSRGLDPDTAARMIVEGFFQEVFHKVGDERVTAGLAEMVAPHVGRLGAR
jgi:Fe-S cluster assembly protein SufD